MKNRINLPFLKNRYFNGKLLTAKDFEQEQCYMEDKRRLINRWMFGVGIVAGLEVIRVDDYNISVEMGLALDYTGREIVVETPVIKKLSMLEGYEEATTQEGDESLYLCIEYDQVMVEPVHNITNHAVHTQEEESYNKWKESYHLYITDEPPEYLDEPITEGEERRAIFSRAENINQSSFQKGIHLARIELVKAGTFYMIDQIIPVPFQQYVYNQPLTIGLIQNLMKEIKLLKEENNQSENNQKPLARGSSDMESEWQFAQGIVNIPLSKGARQGRCFYSKEIPHGLGLGDVEILTHVIYEDYCYSGADDMFDLEEQKAEVAVRLSRMEGTFVIGVRLLDDTKESQIQVGWTAIRKRSRNEIKQEEGRIYINPGLVNMKTRESAKLEAVCVNIKNPQLIWSVETDQGGTIQEDGTYYAPTTPGVYQVNCKSKDQPEIKTSIFIVVRE